MASQAPPPPPTTPCPGPPSATHLLSCGHTIQVVNNILTPCLQNCSHILLSHFAAQQQHGTPPAPPPHPAKSFLCIPCMRNDFAQALHPTYTRLESALLTSNPTAHLWTPVNRMRVFWSHPDLITARADQWFRLKWSWGKRRARGDVFGVPFAGVEATEEGVEELGKMVKEGVNVVEKGEARMQELEVCMRFLGRGSYGGDVA